MANATLSKDEILDAIGNMSVIELAELIDAFKTKFNVTVGIGTFYVLVDGVGEGSTSTGYTNYDSLGLYNIQLQII